ncbi:GtrA family protein [Streptomyces sp. NPDC003236]
MTVTAQMARFALVGVVNTGTYYGCYLALLTALPYLAAHVIAFALSMTGSFLLNSYFTYRTRPTWRKFLLFPPAAAPVAAGTSVTRPSPAPPADPNTSWRTREPRHDRPRHPPCRARRRSLAPMSRSRWHRARSVRSAVSCGA